MIRHTQSNLRPVREVRAQRHSHGNRSASQKGRQVIRFHISSLLLLTSLALAAIELTPGTTSAACAIPAGLDILHYAPQYGKVSAVLIGKSFWPKERVHVTYKITVRNVFQRTYRFDTTTDRFGAFQRRLRFNLGNPHYGYIIKVMAAGQRNDRATLNTWASGQGQ